MKLKEKTYKKFIQFFDKMVAQHGTNEFEIAYSDIQRGTEVASITLKKGLKVLERDGVIAVSPGRNTRYGRIKYLLSNSGYQDPEKQELASRPESDEKICLDDLITEYKNVNLIIENLRSRVRTQEMAISVLQDRLAELEDRILFNK
ncbi:MAG: hypothetical protein ACOX7U_06055 [Desulfitobacteriia bacterium]